MSLEKTLLDAGAECVAGNLVLKHKVMGSYTDGAFVASEDGLEFAETAPVAKAVVTGKGKQAKNARHADDSNTDQHDLEDMLGD